MKIRFSSPIVPWLIFLAALAVRFAVILMNYNNGVFESWEYETIADNILNGLGYRYDHLGTANYAFGPPLYPFLSSLVYRITNHSQMALVVLQAAISSATCLLIFHIGRILFTASIGAIASLLVAFHPGMALYAIKLHSFNIDVFLMSLTVLTFLKIIREPLLKNFLLYALSFSLCLFSRSTVIAFLPVSFILIWIVKKQAGRKILRYSAVSVLTMAIIVLPWIARNYQRVGKLVFTRTCGEQFWRGNNDKATGTSYSADGVPILLRAPASFLARLKQLDEKGQDNLFWAEALAFIRGNPLSFARLTLKKLYYFWWFSPTQGLNYPQSWLYIYKIYYSLMLVSAIPGFFIGRQIISKEKRRMLYALILFCISISFAQALFYVDGRHRWAIEPLLLIFSAGGINLIWDKLKSNQQIAKEAK